jgi:secreted trypsin-like serine protease
LSIDTCDGDSGSPLMLYSKEYRQWIIAGITSYGDGCGKSSDAGIYTRVSMYIDWIKSITGVDGIVIVGENSTTTGENSTTTSENSTTTDENTTVIPEKNSTSIGNLSNLLLIMVFLFLSIFCC